MKNPPNDSELLQFSARHLMHEINMLRQTAGVLPKNKEGTTEYTALLESFVTHARNLIEFLFFEISGDYVRARHFFPKPADWPHKMASDWAALYKRACAQVNHLGIDRVDGNLPEEPWLVTDIIDNFDPILKEFATKASTTKLRDTVREFFQLKPEKQLTWLRGNVRQPNVAIVGPIVVTGPPSPPALKKP